MEDSTHSTSHSQLSLHQVVETQTSLSSRASPISNDMNYVADCLCHLGHTSLRDLEIAKQLQLLSSSPIKRPFNREPSSPTLYYKIPSFQIEMPSSDLEEYAKLDHSTALPSHATGWVDASSPLLEGFEAQSAAERPTLSEPHDEYERKSEIKREDQERKGEKKSKKIREESQTFARNKFRFLPQDSGSKSKRRCVKKEQELESELGLADEEPPVKLNNASLRNMEFHMIEKFPYRASWSLQDDQIIAYLKEEADYDWRDMARSIGNRHTWQAVQMRYCRYLKRRSSELSSHDIELLLKALEQDWNGRWSRIEKTMGPSFNRYRCQGAMLDLLEMSHKFDKAEETGIGESFLLSESENIIISPLKMRLCDQAREFIQEKELRTMSELIALYLIPLELKASN